MHPLNKLLLANRHNPARKFEIKQEDSADVAEVFLYDAIVSDEMEAEFFGGVAALPFIKALREVKASTIHLRVNSPGGSVFAARAMEQALRDHPAKIVAHVDGYAASAASFLIMAADEIEIAPGAMVMIHKGWSFAMGNSDDMLAMAELLDKIDGTLVDTYAARTKADPKQILEWMTAETWFTAKEAVDAGFADRLAETADPKAQARWDLSAYSKAPKRQEPSPPEEHASCDAQALLRALRVRELQAA